MAFLTNTTPRTSLSLSVRPSFACSSFQTSESSLWSPFHARLPAFSIGLPIGLPASKTVDLPSVAFPPLVRPRRPLLSFNPALRLSFSPSVSLSRLHLSDTLLILSVQQFNLPFSVRATPCYVYASELVPSAQPSPAHFIAHRLQMQRKHGHLLAFLSNWPRDGQWCDASAAAAPSNKRVHQRNQKAEEWRNGWMGRRTPRD